MTIHETYTDINGVLTLANADDPHYEQKFATSTEFFDFVRQLIAAGNAHFGTTARLLESVGELNVGKFLSDDDFPAAASLPDDNPDTYTWQDFRREHLAQLEAMVAAMKVEPKAPYTWAEHQAANQATLGEIAAAVGVKR